MTEKTKTEMKKYRRTEVAATVIHNIYWIK